MAKHTTPKHDPHKPGKKHEDEPEDEPVEADEPEPEAPKPPEPHPQQAPGTGVPPGSKG